MKKIFLTLLLSAVNAVQAADVQKTLVAWVRLKDRSVRSGSVLTVQEGSAFDGIIFAELSPDKWMAGSDNFRRTDKDQKLCADEGADSQALIQMAIVYQADRIAIYRNAELYHSYAAKNVDLLGSEDNFVVFGLRHIGGSGSVDGSIEDARIYSRALNADELQKLQPDIEPADKPYAWWDFEGDKVVERTGRYPHCRLSGGAKLSGGKLVLKKGAMLVAARSEAAASVDSRGMAKFVGPYVPETPCWPDNPPDNWAIYHLAHPTFTMGSPFDPNPALFYKGRYHLHYIYRNAAGFVFAHVSSTDMVHWKWHPTVLAPPVTGHGMFSGTGFFTKEGKPAMTYCGTGSGRNWIAYGLDDNLDQWSQPEVMLPRDADGKLMENEPYFDPDIWLRNGVYYGLNGVSSSKPPVMMKSDDLKEWQSMGGLLHEDFNEEALGVKQSEDISCPNMFMLGDQWVLLCISHRLGCRYFIGSFKDDRYLPRFHAKLGGSSNRYFAPESLLTEDGRRVMWAWYRGGETPGVQSLPAELSLPEDGVLRIKPLRELEALRYAEIKQENLEVKGDLPLVLESIKGDHLELRVVIRDPGQHNFGVDVLCDEAGAAGLRITVNRDQNLLEVGNERLPFELKPGEPLTLRIFIDSTLVEVFANDRQIVMNDKGRQAGSKINSRVALFSSGENLKVDTITGWQMKSAYEGSTVFKAD